MLEGIRNGAKGPAGKVIVVVLVLAFGLWGVSSVVPLVFGARAPVTVNGDDITANEIQQRVQQERQQLMQQFGGEIDPSMITEEMVRPQVIERLIQQRLVSQAAEEAGFVLSSREVDRILAREQAFRGSDGRFDSNAFSRMAAQQGMTPTQLRDAIAGSEVTNQWVNGLQRSEFVLPHEVEQYGEYSNQIRDIEYVILQPSDFIDDVDVSETDVANYYDANSQEFTTAERVAVDYVVYSREMMEADVEPTEDEVRAAYDAYVAAEGGGAERQIAHILVTAEQRSDEEARELAESLRERAESEDFAELAQTYSDDPGSADFGGDLGIFQPGMFVGEFESAVEALDTEGQLSSVVETEFGYHIIQLTGIEFDEVASFEEMEDQLRQELIDREVGSQQTVLRDEIANIAFSSLDLTELAETFGLEIQSSDLFTREGGEGIMSESDVISAAFSDAVVQNEQNSDVIGLNDGGLVVLRNADYEAPEVRPLEEVADQIRNMLENRAAQARAAEEAEDLYAALRDGEPVNLSLERRSGVTRFEEDLSDDILDQVFRAAAPERDRSSAFVTETVDQSWAVGRVTGVEQGQIDPEERQQIEEFMRQSVRNSSIEAILTDLRERASIRIR